MLIETGLSAVGILFCIIIFMAGCFILSVWLNNKMEGWTASDALKQKELVLKKERRKRKINPL